MIAGNFDDIAMLNTNTDPTSTSGLKEGGTWSVSANFSLTPDPYGNYGMELNDGSSSNTPNEDVRLIVVAGAGGSTIVELTELRSDRGHADCYRAADADFGAACER